MVRPVHFAAGEPEIVTTLTTAAPSSATTMHLNRWKHHAGYIRSRIQAAGDGAVTLRDFAAEMVVVGHGLMDLYYGTLTTTAVIEEIRNTLAKKDLLAPGAFEEYVGGNDGWQIATASDGSRWVLRTNDDPEKARIHVHPGKHTPHTIRVRANVLCTAAMALAESGLTRKPVTLVSVNRVRRVYLGGLDMIHSFEESESLAGMIELLAKGA